MGAVSNVVFEEILTAVHANDSAAVLGTLGALLDAGNGPQSIARQFVRFLRNCVVAKITNLAPDADATGLAAELLQISVEERRRAARSAANFSEEELSRFLSILLRTFDDLGYRQEQRLHLELGLLKLVHAQRLIPIEEILSQLGTAPVPARPGPLSAAVPKPVSPNPAAKTQPAPPQPQPKPAAQTPAVPPAELSAEAAPTNSLAPAQPHQPPPPLLTIPAPAPPAPANSSESTVETAHSPADSKLETSQLIASTPPGTIPENTESSVLQATVVAALMNTKGQTSAAEQLEDATWTLGNGTLEIQTTLSKTMLPVLINAEADKIIRSTLREHGPAGLTFKLLPGTAATNGTAAKTTRAAQAGSAAELAEKHPLVQEARRLFSADISNVIDLREK